MWRNTAALPSGMKMPRIKVSAAKGATPSPKLNLKWPCTTKPEAGSDPSGTRDRWPTFWGGSIQGQESSREYQLKTPGSGPHGLVSDGNGNIWFTANFKGYIGKLRPKRLQGWPTQRRSWLPLREKRH